MSQTKRLLIVDDSSMIRQAIAEMLADDERFEVVGEAADGREALRLVKELHPDLITLDIVMPGMNGITALKHLMINHPTPTVMISSLTQEGAEYTMDALRYGAVDFIPKPSKLDREELWRITGEVTKKLAWAAAVEIDALRYIRVRRAEASAQVRDEAGYVVSLGAHEGGYGALMKILPHLDPRADAGYVAILYEHSSYVDAFIDYITPYCGVQVERAQDGAPLQAGRCYIAAGEDYATLRPSSEGLALHVHPAPFESQKGSLNRILYSLAETMGEHCCGVVLTGSGEDGWEGLDEVARGGGAVLVQDPATCLVKDMALHALRRGHTQNVIPDNRMADAITELIYTATP